MTSVCPMSVAETARPVAPTEIVISNPAKKRKPLRGFRFCFYGFSREHFPGQLLFLPGLNRIHDFLFVVSSKDYSTEYTEDPADALRKVQEAQAIPSCVQTMQTRRSFLHF